MQLLVKAMANCSDSTISYNAETKMNVVWGLPTEGALRVLAAKLHLQGGAEQKKVPEALLGEVVQKRVATLEFSRQRKGMSTLMEEEGQRSLFIKGAPEYLLKECSQVLTGEGLETLT